MWVRFEGPGEMSFEYNGKRFHFTRNTPPVEISHEIYDYVKSSKTVESGWLRPCDAPPVAGGQKGIDFEGLLEQKDLQIEELKKENKKLNETIDHLQKSIKAHEKKKK